MKLFVAQLDFAVNSDNLKTIFEEYGTVNSSTVVSDRETGRSRGFGFIEMADDNEAHTAIKQLNGSEYRGRELVVKKAEDKKRGY